MSVEPGSAAHWTLVRRHAAVYDRLAVEYDARAESVAGVIDASLRRLLKLLGPRRGTALDIGCGAGVVSRRLVELGFQVHAIDIAPNMIAVCRSRAPEAEYLIGDYWQTQFEEQFDVIVAFAFIHLFPTDLAKRYLRKMRSDLAPEGRLLIGTTDEATPTEGFEHKSEFEFVPPRYRRRWSANEFVDAVRATDMDVLDVARHRDPAAKCWVDVIAGPRS